ncbi:MAG: hypothetical protein ACFHWZ_18840 [Phycisphaerales bacterium]
MRTGTGWGWSGRRSSLPARAPESQGGAPGSGWLVALGGGKDSVVALEMLREAEEAVTAVCVGGYAPVRSCAEASGVELVEIERRLAPELASWNEAGRRTGMCR